MRKTLIPVALIVVLLSNFDTGSGRINDVKKMKQSQNVVETPDTMKLEPGNAMYGGEDVKCQQPEAVNKRPIIGVLAQESHGKTHGDTYFMASYVSFAEMAGARVVPIRTGENIDYYSSLFKKINGVIFPGGGVNLFDSGYAKAAKIIYKLAKQANDAGDYFPLLGICLGHELLTVLETGRSWLKACDAEKLIIPINMAPGGSKSRIFVSAPQDILDIITTSNVTANMHHFCITPENFTKSGLNKSFRLISTNKDRKGVEFVSMMEALKYPFYGTQWHPEKNMFIWDVAILLNHSRGAVQVSQYIADFFVQEARRSMHHYPDLTSEGAALIQNYQPVYAGPPTFGLNYYFNLTHSQDDRNMD